MNEHGRTPEEEFAICLRGKGDDLEGIADLLKRAHALAVRGDRDTAVDLAFFAHNELRGFRKRLMRVVDDWICRDAPDATPEEAGEFARERAVRRQRQYLARKHGGRGRAAVVSLVPPAKPNGEGDPPDGGQP